MPSLKTSKKEIFIVSILLVAAISFYIYFAISSNNMASISTDNIYAEITYNGKLVYTTAINEDKIFSIDEAPNVVFEVKNNKIAFISSDCPDKVCVHTGWLHSGGHIASCLPNKIVLHIADNEGSEVDTVAK